MTIYKGEDCLYLANEDDKCYCYVDGDGAAITSDNESDLIPEDAEKVLVMDSEVFFDAVDALKAGLKPVS